MVLASPLPTPHSAAFTYAATSDRRRSIRVTPAASLRAAALLGETPRERVELLDRLRLLGAGDAAALTGGLVRRALVAVLEYGNRHDLVKALDESLLGLRPKPATRLEPLAAVGTI